MPNGTRRTIAPAGAAVGVDEYGGTRMTAVSAGFLHQGEKAIAANRPARKVENISDCAWIVGIALDRDEVGAGRQKQVRRPAQFDVFVGSIRARWIKKNLVDEDL